MSKKAKQRRKKASIHSRKSVPTVFKQWCQAKGITQASMNTTMHYSYRTIHHLWNGGTKINKSTIHHLALNFKINEEEMAKMFVPAKIGKG